MPTKAQTSSAHTASPWTLDEHNSICAKLPSGQKVQITCMSPTHFTGADVTEESELFVSQNRANAILMKAAPEMQDAIGEALALLQIHDPITGHYKQVNNYDLLAILRPAYTASKRA